MVTRSCPRLASAAGTTPACAVRVQGADKLLNSRLPGDIDGVYEVVSCYNKLPLYRRRDSSPSSKQPALCLNMLLIVAVTDMVSCMTLTEHCLVKLMFLSLCNAGQTRRCRTTVCMCIRSKRAAAELVTYPNKPHSMQRSCSNRTADPKMCLQCSVCCGSQLTIGTGTLQLAHCRRR